MRRIVCLIVPALLLALAGCTATDQAPAPVPAPTIVNVTAPSSGDSGLSVLLTLALVGAFVGIIGAVVMCALWLHERGHRRIVDGHRQAAEDLVVELTGLPMSRARVALANRPATTVGPRVGDLPGVSAHEDRKALR